MYVVVIAKPILILRKGMLAMRAPRCDNDSKGLVPFLLQGEWWRQWRDARDGGARWF